MNNADKQRQSAKRSVLRKIPAVLKKAELYLKNGDEIKAENLILKLIEPRYSIRELDWFEIIDAINDVEWFSRAIFLEYDERDGLRWNKLILLKKNKHNRKPREFYLGKYVKVYWEGKRKHPVWMKVVEISPYRHDLMHPVADFYGEWMMQDSEEGKRFGFSRLAIVSVSDVLPAECKQATLIKFAS